MNQTSVGGVYENDVAWTSKVRTQLGVRLDGDRFDVRSSLPVNSGIDTASVASPKAGVVIGPWRGTEFYVNGGYGFHGNDARGATITQDPSTGAPVPSVTPLVRATGAEVGIRSVAVPHVQSTVSLWLLNLASELVFVGDAGTTEAGRPSHRTGIEWTNYFSLRPWVTVDADVALSSARFADVDPHGQYIPGSAGTIVSLGAAVPIDRRMFGGIRWRYFGARPLIESNDVQSAATSLVNGNLGIRLPRNMRIDVDVFNALNSQASDIDYFYTSRLPGEPSVGVADIHTHPSAGRTARLAVTIAF